MNDYELEKFCERNPDCGCDCMNCPAFASNQREELGLNEEDYEIKTCCLCGAKFEGHGNNPSPVKEKGVCCNSCNEKRVIPARLKRLTERERYNLQCEIDETEDIGF